MLITWILAGAAVVALLVAVFLVLGRRSGSSAGREPQMRALHAVDEPADDVPAEASPRGAVTLPETQSSLDIDIVDPTLPVEEDEPTGPTPRILVTAVGQTDAGRRRKHNEVVMQSIAIWLATSPAA